MTKELQEMGDGESVGKARSNGERVASEVSESGLKITQFKLEISKPSKAFSPRSVSSFMFYRFSSSFFVRSVYGWHSKFILFLFESIELHLWQVARRLLRAFLFLVAPPLPILVPVDEDVLTNITLDASSTNEEKCRTFCGMPMDEKRTKVCALTQLSDVRIDFTCNSIKRVLFITQIQSPKRRRDIHVWYDYIPSRPTFGEPGACSGVMAVREIFFSGIY